VIIDPTVLVVVVSSCPPFHYLFKVVGRCATVNALISASGVTAAPLTALWPVIDEKVVHDLIKVVIV